MNRVFLALTALLVGCGGDDDGDDQRPIDDCYGGLDCRVVEVPQVHAAPGGKTIGIKLVIAHAPSGGGAGAGAAPIVYLEGGPGGSIETDAKAGLALKDVAAAFGRDFVLLEQRGNLLSRPALDCGVRDVDPDPGAVQSCAGKYQSLGYRIEAFNTVENAHDIEDVRVALGASKVILWGGSYGAELAQTAARLHPDSIAGMLLESSAMSGRPYRPFEQMRAQPIKLAAFLADLTTSCPLNPTCAAEMPDLDAAAELALFQQRVTTAPFTLLPGLVIDSAEIAKSLVLISMYGIPNAVLVIRMMYAANHDQLARFDQIRVGEASARDHIARIISFASVNRTSNLVYDCYDTVLNWTDEGLAKQLEDFPAEARPELDAQIAARRKMCAALPPASVPQSELAVATVTSVPTIFFHGGFDWPTPLENVTADLPHFSRAQLFTVPCAGHGIQSVVPGHFFLTASQFFSQVDSDSFTGDLVSIGFSTYCDTARDDLLFVERPAQR